MLLPIQFSSSIRQAAYRSLSLWCKTAKTGCLVETVSDELVKYILQDITPFQSEVTLKVLAGARKYLSKKARQKLHKAQNDATNLAQTHSKAFNPHNTKIIYSDSGNEQLCAAALASLTEIILSVGCFLKPVLQKILQENIVRLSLTTVEGALPRDHLYFDVECRVHLYAVLNALVLSPNHLCPPPIQYANAVFSVAQITESNLGLRQTCAGYLRSIEKILHPQKEALVFPLDAGDVADAFKQKMAGDGPHAIDDADGSESSSSDDEDMEVNLTNAAASAIEPVLKSPEPATPPTKSIPSIAISRPEEENISPKVTVDTLKPSPILEAIARTVKPSDYDSPASISDAESISSTRSLRPRRKSASREMSPACGVATPPPRKSARLRTISEHVETPTASATDGTPRRRSTRLRTPSISGADIIMESPILKLTKIDEEIGAGKKEAETTVAAAASAAPAPADKPSNEDELVDEMAAAFVDEFVDDDDEDVVLVEDGSD